MWPSEGITMDNVRGGYTGLARNPYQLENIASW